MSDSLVPGPVFERRWLTTVDVSLLPVSEVDVLVVGSGIAGLTAALMAATRHSVALVTKGRLTEANTWYAQGGIAGAVGEADSVELHLADTLVVGQGICDEAVVRAVVAEAPEALADLGRLGMRFDRAADGAVALAREGGHSLPRVLHSGDKTGAAVQQALTETLASDPSISVLERGFLVDLLTDEGGTCRGALVFNGATRALAVIAAGAVVLATGGAGQVFPVTTNPQIATGDGVAAAWRAGAEVSDFEFVQFHPTALDHHAAPRFLVSEALRGEGAWLLDCDFERFMPDVHPLAELAPRDVVSREIERVMTRCGRTNVWLDARHLGEEYLKSRFPTIWKSTLAAGYDLSRDLVPVAPAAHYMVGGVRVTVDGRTSVPGLFATGECAATGLHGANRLASNSLLEGLVFSRRIARALAEEPPRPDAGALALMRTTGSESTAGEAGTPPRMWPTDAISLLHEATRAHLGMTRTAEGTAAALAGITAAAESLGEPDGPDGFEAVNLLTVGALIAAAAHERAETRGCHSRLDYPERDDAHWLGHTHWRAGDSVRFEPVGSSEGRGPEQKRDGEEGRARTS